MVLDVQEGDDELIDERVAPPQRLGPLGPQHSLQDGYKKNRHCSLMYDYA